MWHLVIELQGHVTVTKNVLSVTFVESVKMTKHIFSPSGSDIILVFLYQTSWQYSDGDLLTGASSVSGVGKNCDS